MLAQCELPQSAKFLSNTLESMGEYLRRQELSEKVIVSRGQDFHIARGRIEDGSGSLQSADECTEGKSEREEQLERQVAKLQAINDELKRELAEARDTYPEAELSSYSLSQSFSRVEKGVLIRQQSAPEQLLTAHKKIELLEVCV